MTTSKKNGVWGFDLKYPDLWCSTLGHNNFPLVWYVITEGCNSGLAPLPPQENVNNLRVDFVENDTITNEQTTIYPNPFEDYFIVESIVDDQLIVQTLDGKKIGVFKIKKGENIITLPNVVSGIYVGKLISQQFNFKITKL